jgi:hypothetical protein
MGLSLDEEVHIVATLSYHNCPASNSTVPQPAEGSQTSDTLRAAQFFIDNSNA